MTYGQQNSFTVRGRVRLLIADYCDQIKKTKNFRQLKKKKKKAQKPFICSVWRPGTAWAAPRKLHPVVQGPSSPGRNPEPQTAASRGGRRAERPAGKPRRADVDGFSLCRVSAGCRKKKSLDTKEGSVSCRRVLQEHKTCDSGDLTREEIDSCWIINNSSAAGFPFRQKCPENIPVAEKKHF